jgi:hypothetical protein
LFTPHAPKRPASRGLFCAEIGGGEAALMLTKSNSLEHTESIAAWNAALLATWV